MGHIFVDSRINIKIGIQKYKSLFINTSIV